MSEKHIHRGASTITQQLAKNVWLNKEKSYWRKGKEAYLTYELEKKFTKDFILEKYLNVVEFGPGLYGVTDAAQHYFKTKPSNLHLLQAAYLAYLLPNPPVYSRSFSKGELTPFARKILAIILRRLVQYKKITPGEYHYAIAQIPNFPWTGLTRADFAAAKGEGPAIESTDQDSQDLDQFYNQEGGESATEVVPQRRAQPSIEPEPEPDPTPKGPGDPAAPATTDEPQPETPNEDPQ